MGFFPRFIGQLGLWLHWVGKRALNKAFLFLSLNNQLLKDLTNLSGHEPVKIKKKISYLWRWLPLHSGNEIASSLVVHTSVRSSSPSQDCFLAWTATVDGLVRLMVLNLYWITLLLRPTLTRTITLDGILRLPSSNLYQITVLFTTTPTRMIIKYTDFWDSWVQTIYYIFFPSCTFCNEFVKN